MKRYLIFLAVIFGILFFISGRGNRVFAGSTDYYGCGYDGCGLYTHWWCDDGGWCSVGDCLDSCAYGTSPSCGACSVSCGGGTQTCTNVGKCGVSCGSYSQACNTQACCTNSAPSQVTLSSPATGTTGTSSGPTLTWNAETSWGTNCSGNTNTYKFYLGTSSPPALNTSGIASTTTSKATSGLSWGTLYYWNAAANNGYADSTLGTPWTFTTNATPAAPSISAPTNGATGVSLTPVITLSTTDSNSDYLRYKIQIDTVNTFNSGNLRTIDQTTSQTGWSGQNTQTNTAYTSGSTATHTVQTALAQNTLYYLRAYAIDPGGTNTWSGASSTISFTTAGIPGVPTISYPASGAINIGLTPAITLSATDGQSDYLRYKIQIATDTGFTANLQTFDQTASQTGWSGQNTQTSTAYTSGTTATYTVQSALSNTTVYYLRAYAIDPGGSNVWSSASSTISFTTKLSNLTPTGTTVVAGRFGNARSFNGTSDYLSMGNNGLGAMSGSFTIEAWVKTTSIAQQAIISEYQAGVCGDGMFYIQANTGYLVFHDGASLSNIGNVMVNDGVWHHVAYVYNSVSGRGMTFVDGIAGSDTTAVTWRNACGSTDVRIGSTVGGNFFNGTIDNIRVYRLPVSDMKMKQLYYSGFITGCSTGAGFTPEAACPACPHDANQYVDDGNCGKKYCGPAC